MKKYFNEIYQKMIPYITLRYFKSNYIVEFFNTSKQVGRITAKRSYTLRHKVYCDEFGFEEVSREQQEFDIYDQKSIGCVISTKVKKAKTNTLLDRATTYITPFDDPAIAGVRVVEAPEGGELPCLDAIKHHYPEEYIKIKEQLNGLSYAEISRLLILNDHRNKSLFKIQGAINGNYLLFSVFAASFVLSKQYDCAIFMCERKMMFFFKKIGIPFTQLMKKGIEHRGTRYPIKLDIKEVQHALDNAENPGLKTIASLTILLSEKARKGA